jgi:hypothetical protein
MDPMEFIQSDLGQRPGADNATHTTAVSPLARPSAWRSPGAATGTAWWICKGLRGSTRASFRIVRTDISPDGSKLVVIAFHGGAGTPDTVVFLTSFRWPARHLPGVRERVPVMAA